MSKASTNSYSKSGDRRKKAARSARKVGEALKVGAVAERLGVSASMVRLWEKLGLASPARSQSKYRLYTNDDLRVLRRAIYLRRVQGLNAPAILTRTKVRSFCIWCVAGWTSSWRARNSSFGRVTASISAARVSIAGPILERPRR